MDVWIFSLISLMIKFFRTFAIRIVVQIITQDYWRNLLRVTLYFLF